MIQPLIVTVCSVDVNIGEVPPEVPRANPWSFPPLQTLNWR